MKLAYAKEFTTYVNFESIIRISRYRRYNIITIRIFCVVDIPARIQERNLSICYAELKNEKDLLEIQKKQLEVRDVLKALDKRHKVRSVLTVNFGAVFLVIFS